MSQHDVKIDSSLLQSIRNLFRVKLKITQTLP
jgi:hypothetical protein